MSNSRDAAALLPVLCDELLARRGWRTAFWVLSADTRARRALSVLGLRDDGGRDVVRVKPRAAVSIDRRAVGATALARAGSWIYLFGSQGFTSDGAFDSGRHFVARFNEATIDIDADDEIRPRLQIARRTFIMHRLVNDGLREHGVKVLDGAKDFRDRTVRAALSRGWKKQKPWRDLVRESDTAIDVGAATFLPDGRLLIGLAWPIAATGHPLLLELEGIDRFFEAELAGPRVVAVRALKGAGTKLAPAAVRRLDVRDDGLHVITAAPGEERLAGGATLSPVEWWTAPIVTGVRGFVELEARQSAARPPTFEDEQLAGR